MSGADRDTIFALASGPGTGGLQVFRVSGPAAGPALLALAGRSTLPRARQAIRAGFHGPDGELFDHGLLLWFPAPASFTGEDVLELHLHGGRAVFRAATEALLAMPGLRLAEPGEFSRRAFEHGKFDLTAAEAIADLVAAETAAQRRQALRQMAGALGQLYDGWRDRLLRALAHLEAEIDFPEEDLPGGIAANVRTAAAELAGEIAAHLAEAPRGLRLRDGLSIAILGPPNAGKSSLINMLAGREAAIVSSRAGTTRDVIEIHLDLGGYPAVLADTAGLREAAADPVEAEGVRRALARAAEADLKLVLVEAAGWPDLPPEVLPLLDRDAILLLTKTDLGAPAAPLSHPGGVPVLAVSVREGTGVAALLAALQAALEARMAPGAAPALTRIRHRQALEECLSALRRFADARAVELAAEDLRLAARALGRITGRVSVEDMLDIVFRDFCIGK
ncbi:MAG: tRNA uridine-5-carboxymethylaminomethyl(34) synthesis GTPase MnmE [Alphaproteobacteria bacterium]|nr:tRNA uridine-5-carboxymethylaminomethyl(34) synthesis GTPase MnmE [Alphaproteobacteria bacterium]